jgi:hypothetical protein
MSDTSKQSSQLQRPLTPKELYEKALELFPRMMGCRHERTVLDEAGAHLKCVECGNVFPTPLCDDDKSLSRSSRSGTPHEGPRE